MFSEVKKRAKKIGRPPGSPVYTGDKKNVPTTITLITYDQNQFNQVVDASLEQCMIQPETKGVTWVNVEGLSDVTLVKQIAKNFGLHPLTVEDILNVEQRAKVEEFDGYLFITIKILKAEKKTDDFSVRQFSMVLGSNFILSFQESKTNYFDDVINRLQGNSSQRLRKHGSDYLAYRLIDIIVDEYFAVLENLGDVIEVIEEKVISHPKPQSPRMIYRMKRKMLLLRKAIWPLREMLSHLLHVEDKLITPFTRVYLRDVYDHTIQAVDTLETFRDMLASLLDMYLSSLTNRMNEIMKTLTIISTIFIPITAIASIYGMNFSNLPGLHNPWGFTIIIIIMLTLASTMLLYFRSKKWF